jgi:basic membrane lipoprotein Med (substrate-binding protein (PBP1-ABC) superfamily)
VGGVTLRRRVLASLCALGAALLACGDGDDRPPAFRVGLLTPGSIRDQGWNQSAHEGLIAIRDRLGAEIAHQETSTPQDFEAGFRDLAARGFRLVFGHGFEFQDAAETVAKEYPDTIFVTTSGSKMRRNLAPIVFELEQATYVLGYLGGLISKPARLAAIGGKEIPSVASTFLAFEAGAKAARDRSEVSISYIGSWTDVSAAREATLAQIAGGADVLIHNANEAARGFFQAVEESDGVIAFGTNKNQNDAAPGHVLASATLDVPRAMLLVAEEVRSGRFVARPLRFGLRQGVIAVEWNPAMVDRIPAQALEQAHAVEQRVSSGAIEVPRGNF